MRLPGTFARAAAYHAFVAGYFVARTPMRPGVASTSVTLLRIMQMPTQIQVLLGIPNNLYVFDFGRSGTGSAPFSGDETEIEKNWDMVQQNVSINGSKGSLYRRPRNVPSITVIQED